MDHGGAVMAVAGTKKVTISVSEELLVFADRMAKEAGSTRSSFISSVLNEVRERELERLAAEGYRYFGSEAQEFAAASGSAVAEAIGEEYDENL
jgi:hypothetical protein